MTYINDLESYREISDRQEEAVVVTRGDNLYQPIRADCPDSLCIPPLPPEYTTLNRGADIDKWNIDTRLLRWDYCSISATSNDYDYWHAILFLFVIYYYMYCTLIWTTKFSCSNSEMCTNLNISSNLHSTHWIDFRRCLTILCSD